MTSKRGRPPAAGKLENNEENIVEITCGSVTAKFHRNLFTCPGIHQECIEIGGQMVTPKMLSVMGDKASLKDWKNAIRINGMSFRKLMDSGELTFHNHDENCSGKCMSRHGGNSKYDQFINSVRCKVEDLPTMVSIANPLSEPAYTVLRQATGDLSNQPVFPGLIPVTPASLNLPDNKTVLEEPPILVKQEPKDTFEEPTPPLLKPQPVSITPPQPQPTVQPQLQSGLQPLTLSCMNGSTLMPLVMAQQIRSKTNTLESPAVEIPDMADLMEESQTFWRGILEIGLMDVIFRDIKGTLDRLKNDIIKTQAGDADDCKRISKVVSDLGLVTRIKFKLATHKNETEKQNTRLMQEIDLLRKKVAETEMKQRELKRKSEAFDQLMDLTRPKRSRDGTPNPMESAGDGDNSSIDGDASRDSPAVASTEANWAEEVISGLTAEVNKQKSLTLEPKMNSNCSTDSEDSVLEDSMDTDPTPGDSDSEKGDSVSQRELAAVDRVKEKMNGDHIPVGTNKASSVSSSESRHSKSRKAPPTKKVPTLVDDSDDGKMSPEPHNENGECEHRNSSSDEAVSLFKEFDGCDTVNKPLVNGVSSNGSRDQKDYDSSEEKDGEYEIIVKRKNLNPRPYRQSRRKGVHIWEKLRKANLENGVSLPTEESPS